MLRIRNASKMIFDSWILWENRSWKASLKIEVIGRVFNMDKKGLIVMYVLLGIIIVLLVYLIIQNYELKNEVINAGNYLSKKIDNLTSYVK